MEREGRGQAAASPILTFVSSVAMVRFVPNHLRQKIPFIGRCGPERDRARYQGNKYDRK